MQIKRKLPKVNRAFASQLLENEEAENEKDADVADADAKKALKKKKKGPTSSEIFEDERFKAMFENKVFQSCSICIWKEKLKFGCLAGEIKTEALILLLSHYLAYASY